MLVIAPPAPRAAVVLLAGGHGGLQIFANGSMKWGGWQLPRQDTPAVRRSGIAGRRRRCAIRPDVAALPFGVPADGRARCRSQGCHGLAAPELERPGVAHRDGQGTRCGRRRVAGSGRTGWRGVELNHPYRKQGATGTGHAAGPDSRAGAGRPPNWTAARSARFPKFPP